MSHERHSLERLTRSRAAFLVAITALLAANVVAFDAVLDTSYILWFLAAGAEINIALAFLSHAVELDRFEGLVSADPMRFAQAWMAVTGLVFMAQSNLEARRAERPTLALLLLLEMIVATVLLLGVFAALLAAFLILAPPQYVTSLVCGAPWRILARRKFVYRRDGARVADWDWIAKDETPPQGYEEAGFLTKPVTLTGLIAAPVLLLLASALSA